jgi:hypothetical protein
MRDEIRRQAADHEGIVARRLLRAPGTAYPNDVDWATRDLRAVFPGVYVTGWGPITQRQEWRAATLTAPNTSLQVASAGAFWAIRPNPGPFVTVVRPGNRGVNHSGRLRVAYSRTLTGNTITIDGISTTTPERTIIDLWPHLNAWDRSKMLREALRLKVTTPIDLLAVLHRHRRRAGVGLLRAELQARMHLPFDRCKSDGEAFGLVVLDEAGVAIPLVNEVIAGEEADFCWPDLREIVEIDGPQWHRFKEEDARKTAVWTAAGYGVGRIDSDLLFAEPAELLRLSPPPRHGGR